MTTGKRIQRARKEAGLSQKQLGERLGLSASMIGQWENDLRNPKYDTLQRIAAALDVFWVDLVPEDRRGQAIAENVDEKIRNTPGLPETTAYAIAELACYAGEATGLYKGLVEGLELEVFEINKLLVQLNSDGKQKAIERIKELTEIPRYQAHHSPQSLPDLTGNADIT